MHPKTFQLLTEAAEKVDKLRVKVRDNSENIEKKLDTAEKVVQAIRDTVRKA